MEDKFLQQLENLKKPEVDALLHQQQFKLTLMNTQKSAFWGIWFLVVPLFFFACVVMKYAFHWNWTFAAVFVDILNDLDKNPSSAWISPVLLLLLPALGAAFNLLAVLHFTYDKKMRELIVTIKLKWFNLLLAVISIGFIGIILFYLVIESAIILPLINIV